MTLVSTFWGHHGAPVLIGVGLASSHSGPIDRSRPGSESEAGAEGGFWRWTGDVRVEDWVSPSKGAAFRSQLPNYSIENG